MRLTHAEIIDSGVHMKTWMFEIQTNGKLRAFDISGPCVLRARMRSVGILEGKTEPISMIGGEKFTLQAVTAEQSEMDDSVEVSVTMCAACVSLAKKRVTSVTLPAEEAFKHFEGLEGFFLAQLENAKVGKASSSEVMKKLQAKEQLRRDNPMRGSW